MKIFDNNFKLSGIVPPLVTPLINSRELDLAGLEKLINHVINGGVHGVFILGTTGELSRLSSSLKTEVIKNTCKFVSKRVPVLVGITDTSMHDSLKLEKIAKEFGADAAVLAPPFYYHVEQNELLDYFSEVAASISLPLYLYNMPARTNIFIEIETVRKASKIPGVIGIKDSSGDLNYIEELIAMFKDQSDFSVFVGPEEIMAHCVLLGADGGVNGGANFFPELFVQLYEAARNKDLKVVEELQAIVNQISNTLYKVGKGNPNFIKIVKEILSQKGICQENMAKPYIPFSSEEKLQISEYLEKIKIPFTINK